MWTYASGLNEAIRILDASGITEAKQNARELLFFVCDMDYSGYILNQNHPFSKEEYSKFLSMVLERAKHIPLQYLTNRQNFCGLDFYVDSSVLIPRLDTEVLVEYILQHEKNVEGLDVCTGSGCIGISLKKLGRFENITAVDISEEALKVAKKNAKFHNVKIQWIQSDMFQDIPQMSYDFIVSNPPYIRSDIVEELDDEVKKHEPRLALDGDADGLRFYRILADEGRKYLKKDGRIYLEIGFDQAKQVRDLLLAAGFYDIHVIKDLADHDRVIAGRLDKKQE